MKILQIVPSISLIYGGPSQMVLGLAPALTRQGVKVTVLTTDSNGDTGQKPLDVRLNSPVEQDGYEIIYFKCSPFRRYKFSVDLLKWLNKHANEYDLAHIHALFSPVSSTAAAVCRAKKLPYILRPLGTLDPADLRKKKQLKQLYAAVLERPNINQAAAIHFTSEQEAKVSHRFGVNTKDLVIPLGVKECRDVKFNLSNQSSDVKNNISSKFNIPDNVPKILFMSRIDPKKGLDLLIPALEKLLGEGLDFHFVLAGTNPQDPSYEQKIQSQIQASSLNEHTTITGFVTGGLKSALLETADLFVLPSYYENFGIAVAEAMVAGIPVVISDQVHIHQDISGSESGWVGTTDIESIADLIREALKYPEERQRRGVLARKYAKLNYSWDAISQKVVEAYKDITKS
ncbi:MAG: hormogonium polysaccharide biosynthesis glycosyltransferase HpsP [Cyanobacteria bacterium J06628_3]